MFNDEHSDGNSDADTDLPEIKGPGSDFDTIDDAATDLLRYAGELTASDTRNKQLERGGDIVPNGKGGYTYDSIETGLPGEVPVKISSITVGWAHTHPPVSTVVSGASNINLRNKGLSPDDIKQIKIINSHVGQAIPAYLSTPEGSILRFDAATKYRKGIKILP